MSNLLPCPFCGAAPVIERTGFSGRAMYIYCINDNGCPRPKAIGETEERAIENWNTRPALLRTPNESMAQEMTKEDMLELADRLDFLVTSSRPTIDGHIYLNGRAREALTDALTKLRSQGESSSVGSEDYGWVIEAGWTTAPALRYWCGAVVTDGGGIQNEWRGDNARAIRFARKEDGEKIARIMIDGESYRVVEHAWSHSPAGNSINLHWLVDWVHIYATEGHSWIDTPEADKLIELAQREPTQDDAERFKARAALKSFSATASEQP